MIDRRIIAVVAALLWMGASVLACLPNASMTADEMACCQKMAGHCDELGEMGGGHHKCCDTSVNHAAPSAALAQPSTTHDPLVAEAASYAQVELIAPLPSKQSDADWVEPAFSPPKAPFVLKN